MSNKLRERLWDALNRNNSLFFWRFFFTLVVFGLVVGLVFSTLLVASESTPFLENASTFIILSLLIPVLGGVGSFLLFRTLLHLGAARCLEMMDIASDDSRGYVAQSIRRLDFRQLENRLLEVLDEQAKAAENSARNRHLVSQRYGYFIPEEELDKILEDENFYALKGTEKDVILIIAGLRGGMDFFLNTDQDIAYPLFAKLLTKSINLAKRLGIMLYDFSPEYTVLCADLPYAGEDKEDKKIVTAVQKWLQDAEKLFEESGVELLPICLLHYGNLKAGAVSVQQSSPYLITGQTLLDSQQFFRSVESSGLFFSQAYCEHFSIIPEDNALEAAGEGWLQTPR